MAMGYGCDTVVKYGSVCGQILLAIGFEKLIYNLKYKAFSV
jgi:hypothetical protein